MSKTIKLISLVSVLALGLSGSVFADNCEKSCEDNGKKKGHEKQENPCNPCGDQGQKNGHDKEHH